MRFSVIRTVILIIGAAFSINWMIHCAVAGGINIRAGSVEINEGRSNAAVPGDSVSLSFIADTFAFGSSQHEYVVFAVVPANEAATNIDAFQADTWRLYGFVMGTSDAQAARKPQDLRLTLRVVAPGGSGKYKILYNKVPLFTKTPLSEQNAFGSTFSPSGSPHSDRSPRQLFSRHIMNYPREFAKAAEFTVASAPAVATITPPTLYLQVNGETPALRPIKSGTVDHPLIMSWRVGPEFKLPKTRLTYRYQMLISGDEWSEWSTASRSTFFFLPRGSHEFRVQARYDGPEGQATSQIARFNFFLDEPLVARPTKEALAKAAVIGPVVPLPVPDVGEVYKGSRALLFGIYSFDDKNFSQLPRERIEKDLSTLKDSLGRNGFEVKTIIGPKVTAQDVRLAIDDFVKTSRENERLFIYFSTHGFADPNVLSNGYIATTDCKYRSANATCLPLSSFRQQLDEAMNRKVRQAVIAIDSCFSGLGVIVKSPPESNLAELGRRQGIHMLTAGMEDQKALIDDEFGMSTFTHYLAKGLDGHADLMKNGVMSLTGLFLYVQFEVAHRTKSSQIPMMGRVYGSGEMLFKNPSQQQVAK